MLNTANCWLLISVVALPNFARSTTDGFPLNILPSIKAPASVGSFFYFSLRCRDQIKFTLDGFRDNVEELQIRRSTFDGRLA